MGLRGNTNEVLQHGAAAFESEPCCTDDVSQTTFAFSFWHHKFQAQRMVQLLGCTARRSQYRDVSVPCQQIKTPEVYKTSEVPWLKKQRYLRYSASSKAMSSTLRSPPLSNTTAACRNRRCARVRTATQHLHDSLNQLVIGAKLEFKSPCERLDTDDCAELR